MSLLPDKYKLALWKGATFRQRVKIYEEDNLTLRDLSGCTGVCLIKSVEGVELFNLTTENGGILLGGSLGVLEIYIPASDTASIQWKSALYSLVVKDGLDDDVDPILYGTVVVRKV